MILRYVFVLDTVFLFKSRFTVEDDVCDYINIISPHFVRSFCRLCRSIRKTTKRIRLDQCNSFTFYSIRFKYNFTLKLFEVLLRIRFNRKKSINISTQSKLINTEIVMWPAHYTIDIYVKCFFSHIYLKMINLPI